MKQADELHESITLIQQLIEIESHAEHPGQEGGMVEYVKNWAGYKGIDNCTQIVEGQPRNICLRVDGCYEGSTILFNGHLDTVPPYSMVSPFQPRIEEGRIYGRGAVDMKGFVGVMMALLHKWEKNRESLRGSIILALTAGEETYSAGMNTLAPSLKDVDFAVVGEPTELEVGTAHKGVLWLEAEFQGEAVHGSVPEQGVNAIYQASGWIEAFKTNYLPILKNITHPLLGHATANIGMIEGGTRPVTVPDYCTVKMERRLLPGENEEQVLRELSTGVLSEGRLPEASLRKMENFHGVPHGPLHTDSSHPLVQLLCKNARETLRTEEYEPSGLPFWTDGALLQHYHPHLPVVVFGPGSIQQAHSNEEFIAIEQLDKALDIISGFVETKDHGEGENET
ncbi:M20 family metallopeptidase [Salibacterium aidingense]|uniref:M20 family metallopeptidase n=1 Tax=Salibacterium aidingense TaxID=384933 RepID=UPI003BD040C5